MKVLLIVFGSLFGLMILAVIGIAIMLPILGKKLYAQSNDPATRARTLAKIADFRVPPGYRVFSAIDLGVQQSAILIPDARSRGTTMMIQLSGQHLATTNADQVLDTTSSTLGLTAKLMNCNLKRGADDQIHAGANTIALRTYACDDGSDAMHIELGQIRSKASTVQIVATAKHRTIDRPAIDELVSSIR
jgi:hypothetical protein